MPFLVLVSLILLAGVVGLLRREHLDAAGLVPRDGARGPGHLLRAEKQGLQMELDKLRDPQRVALEAQRAGMVPITHPAFLKLADGAVLGDAVPVSALDRQRFTPLPTRAPAGYNPPPVVKIANPPADGAPSADEGRADGTKSNRGQGGQGQARATR
jgi:hypothetical protein